MYMGASLCTWDSNTIIPHPQPPLTGQGSMLDTTTPENAMAYNKPIENRQLINAL